MERKNRAYAKLAEAYQIGDNNGIITSLVCIREDVLGTKQPQGIDINAFQILINLLKVPNTKMIDYSLSIIGNCCMTNTYRQMFKELKGVPHLVLVIKNLDNDSITCRACRLVGNLAVDKNMAMDLHDHGIPEVLVSSLKKHDTMSSGTIIMTFRAIKKLWAIKEFQSKMLPDDVCAILNSCLRSNDKQTVRLAAESLILFSTAKKCDFKLSKELVLNLVTLSKDNELTPLIVASLSTLICYRSRQVWSYLEGSGIAEVFIEFIQKTDSVDSLVCKAFYKLCTESAIRRKARVLNLLPTLIRLCQQSQSAKFLAIFGLFQRDIASITILSQHKEFVPFLVKHLPSEESVGLLSVLSRLEPPVVELVMEENLNAIIKHKSCIGILKKIISTEKFLITLITSGKVWEISKAGCSMQDLGSLGYAEGIIVHLLSSPDKKHKENTSLAIPFLVKPRDFRILYKYLAHHQAVGTILSLLEENPLEERVLASIIRLISIFKVSHSNNYHNSSCSKSSLQNFVLNSIDLEGNGNSETSVGYADEKLTEPAARKFNEHVTEDELITFEFDNGKCAIVDKNILCKSSPVLDAMLNGHFIESRQQKVKLSCCSYEALTHLVKILEDETRIADVSVEVYLELISLTDRFLIAHLNDTLTANLAIDSSSCSVVYQWCQSAGDTKNNAIVRQKAYEFLFSSSEYLMVAMKDETSRKSLIQEISEYLSHFLKDLL